MDVSNRKELKACPHCGQADPGPLAPSVDNFCRLAGIGRTHGWKPIRDNRVEVRRLGHRTVVLMRSIHALLDCSNEQA